MNREYDKLIHMDTIKSSTNIDEWERKIFKQREINWWENWGNWERIEIKIFQNQH